MNTGCGSPDLSSQPQGVEVRGQVQGSLGRCVRRVGSSMGSVSIDLCISPTEVAASTAPQSGGRGDSDDSNRPGLAPASVVRRSRAPSGGYALAAASAGGPTVPRSYTPSCFTVAGFNGMAIESQVLRDRGLSDSVISTMLRARKSSSRKICHRTWKAYISVRRDGVASTNAFGFQGPAVFTAWSR